MMAQAAHMAYWDVMLGPSHKRTKRGVTVAGAESTLAEEMDGTPIAVRGGSGSGVTLSAPGLRRRCGTHGPQACLPAACGAADVAALGRRLVQLLEINVSFAGPPRWD